MVLLALSYDIDDNFVTYGDTNDGIVWKNGNLDVECHDCTDYEAVCFSFDASSYGSFEFDECYHNYSSSYGGCGWIESATTYGDDFCFFNPSLCYYDQDTDNIEADYPNSLLNSIGEYHSGVNAVEICRTDEEPPLTEFYEDIYDK